MTKDKNLRLQETAAKQLRGLRVQKNTFAVIFIIQKGKIRDDDTVSIQLHIIVDNGVNLMAVSRSIMSEVRYNVSRITGVTVKSVDVYIDSMVIG